MTIGQTVKRFSPTGQESIFTIDTYEQLEYLRDLQAEGYTYEVMPTVHSSDNTCVACEG